MTIDYLVKDQSCNVAIASQDYTDTDKLIEFRLEANRNTYAGYMNEVDASRIDSHDYHYQKGPYEYHDTYIGGEQFAGEEAVFKNGKSLYAMNYMGRVLDERFSGDFLKEALRAADEKQPFRGPAYYQSGQYIYQAKVVGDISWFQGYEEIYCEEQKVYECYFHGGILK